MNLFWEALQWIVSPSWTIVTTQRDNDILARLAEHLGFTFASLIAAAIIAIPIGYAIGHTGKGREIAVAAAGAARALPSLGLLTILALTLGILFAPLAAVIVFLVLGVPSILAGSYAGIEAIDRRTVDAARAVGMTEWQILTKVEIPLGLPLLLGGIRSAALQIVATTTLAAYIGLGGLGVYILGARGAQLHRDARGGDPYRRARSRSRRALRPSPAVRGAAWCRRQPPQGSPHEVTRTSRGDGSRRRIE